MPYNLFFLDPATRMYYYILVFSLLIVFLLKNHKIITSEYRKISKKTLAILLIITVFGFILRFAYSPMQTITGVSVWSHRDAVIYISEDQKIPAALDTRGYSLLISPIYSLTGDIVFSSHLFDMIIGSLSIIMLFLLTYLLFKDIKAAMVSALILCLLPWHIFFSGTHGVEITTSFFIMLSLILILLSVKSKEPQMYFLTYISILFCGLIKKEETILLLVLILYFIHKKSPIKMQNKMYICIYAILCILLTLPYIAEITHENFYEGQFGATYLTKNIISLLEIFQYNFHITFLMLTLPVLYLLDKKVIIRIREQILFLILWLSIVLIPFILNKHIGTRYFLFFVLPFIILESYSVSKLLKTKYKNIVSLILAVIVLMSALYITIECQKPMGDCKYFVAQPLRWTDLRLPEIYAIFNNTNKSYSYLIFVDPQSKNAFELLYRDYPPQNVHTAWQLHNEGAIPILNVCNNSNTKCNIYLIDFEDEFEEHCKLNYYVRFCEVIKDYDKELYYSGDRYKIYEIIPGAESSGGLNETKK